MDVDGSSSNQLCFGKKICGPNSMLLILGCGQRKIASRQYVRLVYIYSGVAVWRLIRELFYNNSNIYHAATTASRPLFRSLKADC